MILAAISLVLLATAPDGAAGGTPAPPPVHAVRVADPIHVDGVLSEAVWQNGNAVTGFTQRDPVEGAKPSYPTEVRVAYDDDALYVGARMHDASPDSIIARLTRRDVDIPADKFVVYLDPFHDRRSGYYFMVNAGGTLYDGTLYNDSWSDDSWDGVWEGKVHIDEQGWTAEMRIPYSQLRFQNGGEDRWGVNFRRSIQRFNELDYVVFQPKKGSGFVSRFPDLVGIQNIQPGHSVELLPYVTTKAEYMSHDPFDPFHDGSDYVPDAGADLRMGIGSRLTLNATANPDFGQVEVDPAVVNLSDVETYFQEKRPFFVEGSSVFQFGQQGANSYWGFNWPQPTFFYSRRVGRAPQGSAPDADFTDSPLGTTILGAAKLTGKLTQSWNFGTLHALTARESAEYQNGALRDRAEVEPLTYYGVVRGLREFKERRHGLGVMATLADRNFDDPRLRDELNASSFMTGVDGWTFLDHDKMWVLSGWTAMSHVTGTAARITDLQQDSRHYFQRPDAGHVEVDPNATSLTGFGSRYWINKEKGSWIFNSAAGFMTPKFDVNDMGFMSRADVINTHVAGGYKWTEPTAVRKYQSLIGGVWSSYDFQGNPVSSGLYTEGSTEFSNNYSWNYWSAYNPPHVANRATRGGPVMIAKPGYELGTYFDTDGKAKLFYYASVDAYTQPEADSWTFSFSPGIEWKPSSNLTLSFAPGIDWVRDDAQYLDTYEDPTASETFGNRYVFGSLYQTTISASVRLNWSFTPALSLQLYAQPLISAGDYSGIKSLARGHSYDFDVYGDGASTYDGATGTIDADGAGPAPAYELGNPDFNFRSLRGNAVLRWEYMPGSTLFLVWTQQRSDEEEIGDVKFGRSFRRLVSADADNIFLAKVSYYFNL